MLIVPVRPFPYNVSIKYTLECQTEEGNGGGGLYQKILQNVTNRGLENSWKFNGRVRVEKILFGKLKSNSNKLKFFGLLSLFKTLPQE